MSGAEGYSQTVTRASARLLSTVIADSGTCSDCFDDADRETVREVFDL